MYRGAHGKKARGVVLRRLSVLGSSSAAAAAVHPSPARTSTSTSTSNPCALVRLARSCHTSNVVQTAPHRETLGSSRASVIVPLLGSGLAAMVLVEVCKAVLTHTVPLDGFQTMFKTSHAFGLSMQVARCPQATQSPKTASSQFNGPHVT